MHQKRIVYRTSATARIPHAHPLTRRARALQGVDHMHQKRIIHRDIKPMNVFIGKGDIVKLGDLGIAKILKNNAAAMTQVPPENFFSPHVLSYSYLSRPLSSPSLSLSLGLSSSVVGFVGMFWWVSMRECGALPRGRACVTTSLGLLT